MSSSAASQLGNGALQSVGRDLTDKILQTPQGQQALAYSANTIVQGTSAILGAGTAAVVATTTAAAVAAPVVVAVAVVGGVGYGLWRLWDWLD